MIGKLQAEIKDALERLFPFLKGRVVIIRERRMSMEIEQDRFYDVILFAAKYLDFNFISAITGRDEGNAISIIYHLTNQEGIILSVKIRTNRARPQIITVTRFFPSADIYERELVDLLGVHVDGLAAGIKYPLPEDWPEGQYPLRKDWKQGENDAE